jgi:hypothetical protein
VALYRPEQKSQGPARGGLSWCYIFLCCLPRGSAAAEAGPSWVGGARGMPSGEIWGETDQKFLGANRAYSRPRSRLTLALTTAYGLQLTAACAHRHTGHPPPAWARFPTKAAPASKAARRVQGRRGEGGRGLGLVFFLYKLNVSSTKGHCTLDIAHCTLRLAAKPGLATCGVLSAAAFVRC